MQKYKTSDKTKDSVVSGKKDHGFTLVELIVVIVVLAILSTIAFLSFNNYMSSTRDSTRLADISNISKGLIVTSTTSGRFPLPERSIKIFSGSELIGYQGEAGSQVLGIAKLSQGGKDPLDLLYYTYNTNISQSKHQIVGFLENKSSYVFYPVFGLPLKVYAKDYRDRFPYERGDSLGIILSLSGNVNPTYTPIQDDAAIRASSGFDILDVGQSTGKFAFIDNAQNNVFPSVGDTLFIGYTSTGSTYSSGSSLKGCLTQPDISNATFKIGAPSIADQPWVFDSSGSGSCSWKCNTGYNKGGGDICVAAKTVIWNGNGADANWNTPSNWSGGLIPTVSDDVVFDSCTKPNMTMNLSGGVTVASLSIGQSCTTTLTLSNGSIENKLIITKDLSIGTKGTITHSQNSTTLAHIANIKIDGNATIAAGGKIDVSKMGYNSTWTGAGVGGGYVYEANAGGGGHGGDGGNGGSGIGGGITNDDYADPTDFGSAGGGGWGGWGGGGGGLIKMSVRGTLTVNGSIRSDGGKASWDGGGGAGGTVNLDVGTIAGNGIIAANGWNSSGGVGGGGAGGRIAVRYDSKTFPTANFQTYGGTGVKPGGVGTLYLKYNADADGDLYIIGNSLTLLATNTRIKEPTIMKGLHIGGGARIYSPLSGSITMKGTSLTIPANSLLDLYGNLELPNLASMTLASPLYLPLTYSISPSASLTIGSGGNLTTHQNLNSRIYYMDLALANLTIDAGGKIDVSKMGYNSSGTGAGPGGGKVSGIYGGGGGHGGAGGTPLTGANGGSANDSNSNPIDLGSAGGGGSGGSGGAGGGAIKLTISGNLVLNGSIKTDGGKAGWDGGGGAGGSVWINAGNLSGNGTITAIGGICGSSSGGNGGGGRVAIYYGSSTFPLGNISVAAGNGGIGGGAGTLYTLAQ